MSPWHLFHWVSLHVMVPKVEASAIRVPESEADVPLATVSMGQSTCYGAQS